MNNTDIFSLMKISDKINVYCQSHNIDNELNGEVYVWPQRWPQSFFAGKDRISSFITSLTVVIVKNNSYSVFHDGAFAYTVTDPTDFFYDDFYHHNLAEVGDQRTSKYFKT